MKKFFKILVLAVFFVNQTGIAVFADEFEKSSSYEETHQEHFNSENEHNDYGQSVSEKKNSSEDHKHKENEEEKMEFLNNNENENNDNEENERRGKNDNKKSELDEEYEHKDGDKDHIDKKHESEEESSDEDSGDEVEEINSGDSEDTQEQMEDEEDTDEQEDQDDESQEGNHDQDQDDIDDGQGDQDSESVVEETETIDVYVLTTDQILFKDEVTFSKCSSFEGQVKDFYAYCALNQIDPNSLWTFYESFGNSVFLDQIFDIHSPEDWSAFWAYFKNRQEGVSALNKDVFSDGDELLVTLGAMPISLATTTDAVVGATTTIQAKYFGYDESFLPTYFNLADADIYLNDEFVGTTTSEGLFDFVADTAGDNIFEAKKGGFADSLSFLVTFVDSGEGGIGRDNSSSGGGGGSDSDKKTLDVEALLHFLDSKQKDDGSFGSDLYTDWAAVAYGSQSRHSTAKEKLKTFLISDNLQGGSVTDYERRVMALMALGVNPYEGAKENYIQKIYDSFDGTQFGDSGLVNDDIFAVLVLRNVGFKADDTEIKKAIEFIISKQSASGSIDSPDLTSAGIQALELGDSNLQTTNAINKAVNYLKSLQQSDGGFNDSFATSWIILGFIAGGESPSSLEKNGNNPFDYLANLQQTDGGLEEASKDLDTRVWTSSYAVPAGLQKTWDDILKNFSKKVTEKTRESGDGENTSNSSGDASTTTEDIVSGDGVPSTPTVLGASISNDEGPSGFTGNGLEEETEVEEVLLETQESATTTEEQMPAQNSDNNNIYIWILIIAGVVVIVRIIRWKK